MMQNMITTPIEGRWVKIGEVQKINLLFRATYSLFAVFELIEEDGMRKYKEVYMASDSYTTPKLESQKFNISEIVR